MPAFCHLICLGTSWVSHLRRNVILMINLVGKYLLSLLRIYHISSPLSICGHHTISDQFYITFSCPTWASLWTLKEQALSIFILLWSRYLLCNLLVYFTSGLFLYGLEDLLVLFQIASYLIVSLPWDILRRLLVCHISSTTTLLDLLLDFSRFKSGCCRFLRLLLGLCNSTFWRCWRTVLQLCHFFFDSLWSVWHGDSAHACKKSTVRSDLDSHAAAQSHNCSYRLLLNGWFHFLSGWQLLLNRLYVNLMMLGGPFRQ